MMSNEFEHSRIFQYAESIDYATGGIVSRQVIQRKAGNVTLFAFDAGQKLSEHTAPFDALIQVLEGEGEILIQHQPYRLTAGQAIIMPAHIPHAVNAVGRFKMLLIMIKDLQQ